MNARMKDYSDGEAMSLSVNIINIPPIEIIYSAYRPWKAALWEMFLLKLLS